MARKVTATGVAGLSASRGSRCFGICTTDRRRRRRTPRRSPGGVLGDDGFSAREPTSEADPRTGYSAWSEGYDEPGNPIIAIEEPVVRALVEALGPGEHSTLPAGQGDTPTSGRARSRRRRCRSHPGDVEPGERRRAGGELPGSGSARHPGRERPFDLVVCGLALAHLAELDRAVASWVECSGRGSPHGLGASSLPGVVRVARTVRGCVRPAWLRPRAHPLHADYLAAFRAGGSDVRAASNRSSPRTRYVRSGARFSTSRRRRLPRTPACRASRVGCRRRLDRGAGGAGL